jgi:hypothetical protein
MMIIHTHLLVDLNMQRVTGTSVFSAQCLVLSHEVSNTLRTKHLSLITKHSSLPRPA